MGDKSKIEWTEATWNPIAGCTVLSPGCTNCYAMKMADRIQRMSPQVTHYAGTTMPSKAGPVWTGKLTMAPDDILLRPLKWKRPRTIFVNSMSDLFHENVPYEWIDKVFAVMALAPQHTFQVLTKRAERMRDYCSTRGHHERDRVSLAAKALQPDGPGFWWTLKNGGAFLPNVWLGVSAEDQKRADERIPHLLQTPAAVRFISAEPLLGPIDFTHIDLPGGDQEIFPLAWPAGRDDAACHPFLDWVIVGGESGPNARPMHPDWARSIRDQCQAAGVPFFFKQWGEHAPNGSGRYSMIQVGKRAAGRLLDGRAHNEMPEASR